MVGRDGCPQSPGLPLQRPWVTWLLLVTEEKHPGKPICVLQYLKNWYHIIWNDLSRPQVSRSCGSGLPLTRWRSRCRGSPPARSPRRLRCVRRRRTAPVPISPAPPRTPAGKRYGSPTPEAVVAFALVTVANHSKWAQVWGNNAADYTHTMDAGNATRIIDWIEIMCQEFERAIILLEENVSWLTDPE